MDSTRPWDSRVEEGVNPSVVALAAAAALVAAARLVNGSGAGSKRVTTCSNLGVIHDTVHSPGLEAADRCRWAALMEMDRNAATDKK